MISLGTCEFWAPLEGRPVQVPGVPGTWKVQARGGSEAGWTDLGAFANGQDAPT